MRRSRTGRGRILTEALAALVALSRRHLTYLDLAAALGVPWRTGYRIMRAIEAAGIGIERHRRGREVTYHVRPASLRRLLGL